MIRTLLLALCFAGVVAAKGQTLTQQHTAAMLRLPSEAAVITTIDARVVLAWAIDGGLRDTSSRREAGALRRSLGALSVRTFGVNLLDAASLTTWTTGSDTGRGYVLTGPFAGILAGPVVGEVAGRLLVRVGGDLEAARDGSDLLVGPHAVLVRMLDARDGRAPTRSAIAVEARPNVTAAVMITTFLGRDPIWPALGGGDFDSVSLLYRGGTRVTLVSRGSNDAVRHAASDLDTVRAGAVPAVAAWTDTATAGGTWQGLVLQLLQTKLPSALAGVSWRASAGVFTLDAQTLTALGALFWARAATRPAPDCGRAFDHVVDVILKQSDVPDEVKQQVSALRVAQRADAVAKCASEPPERVACLLLSHDLQSIQACAGVAAGDDVIGALDGGTLAVRALGLLAIDLVAARLGTARPTPWGLVGVKAAHLAALEVAPAAAISIATVDLAGLVRAFSDRNLGLPTARGPGVSSRDALSAFAIARFGVDLSRARVGTLYVVSTGADIGYAFLFDGLPDGTLGGEVVSRRRQIPIVLITDLLVGARLAGGLVIGDAVGVQSVIDAATGATPRLPSNAVALAAHREAVAAIGDGPLVVSGYAPERLGPTDLAGVAASVGGARWFDSAVFGGPHAMKAVAERVERARAETEVSGATEAAGRTYWPLVAALLTDLRARWLDGLHVTVAGGRARVSLDSAANVLVFAVRSVSVLLQGYFATP